MSDSGDHSTAHILQSLAVNVVIALVKAGAALFTGSGAMLAEAIHSGADCGNQILLLVGVKQAKKPATSTHPLGHGRDLYFWSFLVALMLFTGGGVFSIYEGIHKLMEPEPVSHAWVGVLILAFSTVLEGGATLSNIKEINKRRGARGFFTYLHATTDSDLVVIFGENAAAVLGLGVALLALGAASLTHDETWDAIGSLLIGLILVAVALFLARKIRSLLLGEAGDPRVLEVARKAAHDTPNVESVLHVMSLQQGPGEVLLFVKLAFTRGVLVEDACHSINDFEARVRGQLPEARWIFVEPDIPRA
jgi:cation diffusion facilitator family transporter